MNKENIKLKKVKFIYNPFSGGGKIKDSLDDIFQIYQSNGYLLDLFRISYDADLVEIIDNIEEYDHFLISGGDGTVNQVINIIKKAQKDIPIGILPCGTANDFATLLNVPKKIEDACEAIIKSQGEFVDIGVINDRYFLNIASAGVFSGASHDINLSFKKGFGRLAYYLNGVKGVSKNKKIKVLIETENIAFKDEILAILIFNGKSVGLINMIENASISDGFFDVIVVKPNNIIELIEIFTSMITTEQLNKKINGITHFKSSNLKITLLDGHKTLTDIDGEKGPNFPLEVKCLEKGLKVLGSNLNKK